MKAQSSRAMATTILLRHEAPCGQAHEAGVEPVLCLPAQGEHLTGLSALAVREFFTDLGRRRVMLGTFNEDPPRVGVACFGDSSLATFVAAGRFTGNQPKISHKLAGMIEALESPEFGNRDHCRQELEAFESHERIDSGPKSPTRKPVEQGRLATLDSLLGGFLGRRTNHYRMDLPGPL
jgi:hypothetical protein